VSYGNGYGNNRSGSYNRGGGGNNNAGGSGYGNQNRTQKKPNQTTLRQNDRKSKPEDSDMWGTIVVDFALEPGMELYASFWANKDSTFGPKISLRPKQQQGAQQGRQGYGNRGGGYQRQQQPQQQQQGMYNSGPDLDDEVPFG